MMNKTTLLAGALALSLLANIWLGIQLRSTASLAEVEQTIQKQASQLIELNTKLDKAVADSQSDSASSEPSSSHRDQVSSSAPPSSSKHNASSTRPSSYGSSSYDEEDEDAVPPYGYKQIHGLISPRELDDSVYEGKFVVTIGDSGLEFATIPAYEGHLTVESRTTDLPAAAPEFNTLPTYDVIVDDYLMGSFYIIHMDYVLDLDKILPSRVQRIFDMDNVFTVGYIEYGNVPEEKVTNYVQSMTVRELSRNIRETIRKQKN